MAKSVIAKGRTLADALARGATLLGVPTEHTTFQILEQPTDRFTGHRSPGDYKLKVTYSEVALEQEVVAVTRPALPHPAQPSSRVASPEVPVSASPTSGLGDEPAAPSPAVAPSIADPAEALLSGALSDAPTLPEAAEAFAGLPESPATQPARAEVTISEEGLTALLTLHPSETGDWPTRAMVEAALSEAQVCVGLDRDALETTLHTPVADEPVVVATGTPPRHGTDAALEYLFKSEETPPEDDSPDRRDFRVVRIFCRVEKGQPLARRIPPTRGEPGVAVTGDMIPCRRGRDVSVAACLGRNVILSGDKTEIQAGIEGHVVSYGSLIHVDTLYRVPGDINYATGNVDFPGTVDIRGAVLSGFVVKATGDILVGEQVEAALLEAGGAISIQGGMYGKNIGILRAGSQVSARFLNQCRVEAGGDVFVRDSILHATVHAGGGVSAELGHGVILGGTVIARQDIRARVLGSPAGVVTQVTAGHDWRLLRQIETCREQILKQGITMQKIDRTLLAYQKRSDILSRLPPDRQKAIRTLAQERQKLKDQMTAWEQESRVLLAQAAEVPDARVSVRETLYAGVQVTLGGSTLTVQQDIHFATLYRDRILDIVRIGPY